MTHKTQSAMLSNSKETCFTSTAEKWWKCDRNEIKMCVCVCSENYIIAEKLHQKETKSVKVLGVYTHRSWPSL